MPSLRSRLTERLTSGEALVAGVLSGTSADGIDVALVRFAPTAPGSLGRPELFAFETVPFDAVSPGLEARVRSVLDGAPPTLSELARLDRDLGRAFGTVARAAAEREGRPLELVASHGQTVWHHDGAEGGAATLQLGDGCEVAEAAGCRAVSDFRRRDVAAGGEGAPLVAVVEDVLFPDVPRPLVVLNLGGISNVTVLRAGATPWAFDTGPAGTLLDGLARRLLDRPLDADGAAAAEGRVLFELVERWSRHPFLALAPPKSTGRDTFGERWIDGLLAELEDGPGPADLLRTATAFVARCVVDALGAFAPDLADAPLVLAGGGARHRVLARELEERWGGEVVTSAVHGVDPDAREALAFAVLGARRVLELPSTVPSATGAREGRVLGKESAPAVPPGL